MSDDLVDRLREPRAPLHYTDSVMRTTEVEMPDRLHLEAADEIERLQRIIDSRPAINAGLPQTYIEWSNSIYQMDFSNTRETKQ